jgi:hypothetical protein
MDRLHVCGQIKYPTFMICRISLDYFIADQLPCTVTRQPEDDRSVEKGAACYLYVSETNKSCLQLLWVTTLPLRNSEGCTGLGYDRYFLRCLNLRFIINL